MNWININLLKPSSVSGSLINIEHAHIHTHTLKRKKRIHLFLFLCIYVILYNLPWHVLEYLQWSTLNTNSSVAENVPQIITDATTYICRFRNNTITHTHIYIFHALVWLNLVNCMERKDKAHVCNMFKNFTNTHCGFTIVFPVLLLNKDRNKALEKLNLDTRQCK